MANIAVRRRWATLPRVSLGLRTIRRYPVLPVIVLIVVLIIPSLFASQIAPNDPREQDLFNRLAPPAWMDATIVTKTVVRRVVNPEDRQTQIPIASARQLTVGTARGEVSKLPELTPVTKTVVQRVQNRGTEISLGDARRLEEGPGIGETLELNPEIDVGGEIQIWDLALGDEIQYIEKIAGTWTYPFGTDSLGRGLLSRIIHGARVSLIISLLVIALSGAIGIALGLMAGFFGGWVDYVISRLIDMVMALPPILVALVLVMVFQPGMTILIAIIVGFLWSQYARMVRGEALSLVQQDFVARARVAGCSNVRIMARYILPNLFNSLVVLATLQIGYVIIIESSLSFLGLGIPPPDPTWGNIVADGRDLIIQTAWWVSLFAGLAIMLTVLSMNLLGDWLRDTLDPKLRQI